MDNMKSTYLEEAKELLENLESSLLLLESTPNDSSLIEEIFRAMHTLKGSSGMFGFDNVASFVHNLESIYDLIREGQLNVSKDLLDVTLKSVDHLEKIIYDTDLAEEENLKNNQILTEKILDLMPASSKKTDVEVIQLNKTNERVDNNLCTYYILFEPEEGLFDNGTNPLYILDELFTLGKCEVFPRFRKLDNIDDFDPVKCLSYWEILLCTKVGLQELWDVFLFVENDGKIKIEKLADFDLLSSKEMIPLYEKYSKPSPEDFIDLDDLKNLGKELGQEIIQKADEISDDNNSQNKNAPLIPGDGLKIKSAEKHLASIRVASEKIDSLMNIVSELVTTQASLSLYSENNYSVEIEAISESVEKLSKQLRDVAFGMTLVPLSSIMGRFQRLVRDISNDLGKMVDFKIEGDDTELDKNIIESLTAPLMHILRNSLDHGIETKEERKIKGKPEYGNILFKAFYSGANVIIQIKDDGKGIDVEAIRNKAISKGIIAQDANLSDKEAFELIFLPSFSTAKEVTDVSGRGVGMDVVKRNVSDLRGEITIDSIVNQGSTITIKLPLTLSIIDGLLVRINENKFLVPLSVVGKCYEIPFKEMENNFHKLLVLDGRQIPFLNLREVLDLHGTQPETTEIIVVNSEDRLVGLSVDEILGEYQAVLKPIGKHYKEQDYISGATILGDGSVALVWDTNRMIKRFQSFKMVE